MTLVPIATATNKAGKPIKVGRELAEHLSQPVIVMSLRWSALTTTV